MFGIGVGSWLATRTMPAESLELYVAPDGNDQWSGRLEAPNSDRSEGPLATLTAARDAARQWKQSHPLGAVTVWLRGGRYQLDEPFVLGPEDSGTEDTPTVYAAYPGERPILSGGRRLTEWKVEQRDGRTVWVHELEPGRSYHQLFVNGARRPRARLPKSGWFQIESLPDVTSSTPWNEGQRRFVYRAGDLEAWPDADEGEIIALHFWTDSHLPIRAIDPKTRTVELEKRSVFRLTAAHSLTEGAFYSVENVLAALTEPGEWVYHAKDGRLYYLPLPDESPESVEAILPELTTAIRLEGAPEQGQFVEHVHLVGLTVSHTEWWFGPEYQPTWPREDIGGMVQAAYAVPGAIVLRGARHCRLERCTVQHVGTYGVELERGCQDNVISACRLVDLGAGGIKIGETVIREPAGEQTHRNTVEDCRILSGGRLFHSAVGVWIGHSGGNRIVHNEIADLYYTGVSVGWSWGYGRSLSAHNRIEYNHIHHIGQGWLSDMGGIYTLGVSPGMVLRGNRIHDVQARQYGGWGIYPDEGTSHAVIEENIVYRVNRCGFHLHYGKDNLIQNNIFAFAEEAQICRTRPDPFVFRRNIVYWERGPLLGGNWNELNVQMDYNLYYVISGEPIRPAGRSWEEWQAAGMDRHSLVADPGFVAPEADDFRLRPDSPAWQLGFRPIDLSRAGPRRGTGSEEQ